MSDWISVRERMPDDTKSVLVWCPSRRNKYTACWVCPDWIHFGGRFDVIVLEDVTHWMPTPEPPKIEDRVEVIRYGGEPASWIVTHDGENVAVSAPAFKSREDAEVFRLGTIERLKRKGSSIYER